jgi:4'-phosphopantetheinyl transferase
LRGFRDHCGVSVVTARLDVSGRRLAQLGQTLSAGERGRVASMVPGARRRAVASRGLLREQLGARLGIDPWDVPLRLGTHGKPELDGSLRFNVAHSGDLALLAFAEGREVGVDVERVRPLVALDLLALEVLGCAERDALASLPAHARERAFLEAWTRKEAYLKGRGLGLNVEPRAVVVSIRPGERAALLAVEGEPGEAERWTLHRLSPSPGHVATLALGS